MFIQPDWWEVPQPGVGTNRYAYAFDDPVNGKDATGWAQACSKEVQDKNKGSGIELEEITGPIGALIESNPAGLELEAAVMGGGYLLGRAASLLRLGGKIEQGVDAASKASRVFADAPVTPPPAGGILRGGNGAMQTGTEAGKTVLNTSKTYYRSMSKAEAAAVKETEKLRGGRAGETYFTDQRFRSGDGGARVKDRLSLPQPPEVQMEFNVLNEPTMSRNGLRVEPDFGGTGGGREFMTTETVEVEILNVQPY